MQPKQVLSGNGQYSEQLQRVRALLNEALKIVDEIDLPPCVGAKLQEAIDGLEDDAA